MSGGTSTAGSTKIRAHWALMNWIIEMSSSGSEVSILVGLPPASSILFMVSVRGLGIFPSLIISARSSVRLRDAVLPLGKVTRMPCLRADRHSVFSVAARTAGFPLGIECSLNGMSGQPQVWGLDEPGHGTGPHPEG